MTRRGKDRNVGLRAQILFIVLGGAIVPLGLVGLWLTSSGVRSGKALLRSHLEESADRFVAAAASRWEYRHADLALIAENEASVRTVMGGEDSVKVEDRAFLDRLATDLSRTIPMVVLRDLNGRTQWSSTPASRAADAKARGASSLPDVNGASMIRIESPIADGARRVGTAITDLALSALIPADSARPLVPGARVGIRNRANGTIVLPLPGAEELPKEEIVTISGDRWMTSHRSLVQPPLDVVIAAPMAPYVAPFTRAARAGVAALLAVAALAIMLTLTLTARAIRPLEELARASDAVSAGKLHQQVIIAGPSEMRHVGAAFNLMTEHLRTTLDALSRRNALAAVGEFATSLSHDVRNALTSIKVDLDRLALREVPDPIAAGLINRAVNSVARLETSVAGALRVARHGHAPLTDIDLRAPIRAAADTVRGSVSAVPGTLVVDLPPDPITVRGDAAALEQLFANLMFNAAQALKPGGTVVVGTEPMEESITIVVSDTGVGIAATDMARLDTPFFSSKASGTGLGLPIARQIIAAHGGELSIESDVGRGTRVRVRIPIGTNRSPVLHDATSEPAAVG
jgi:signal transduction histidine kinase